MDRRRFLKSSGAAGIGALASQFFLGGCYRRKDSPLGSVSDIQKIRKIIDPCAYSEEQILGNGVRAFFRPDADGIFLSPFYHFDSLSEKGTCMELMSYVYGELRRNHPEYHVMRAIGQDPDFFSDAYSTHGFLLLSSRDMMEGEKIIASSMDLSDILGSDPLLVDPSFGRITAFSGSGYSVSHLYNQGSEIFYSNALLLSDSDLPKERHVFSTGSVPLCMSKRGEIVYLSKSEGFPPAFEIGFQRRKCGIAFHGLGSGSLDDAVGDDARVRQFVDFFRKMRVEKLDYDYPRVQEFPIR
jgi:hypothetical protein